VKPARYKWFFSLDASLYKEGQIIHGAEYVLLVEDSDDISEDPPGDVYLLDASPDDTFSDYDLPPGKYITTPGEITDLNIAGYRFFENKYVDLYVKLSELGRSNPYGLGLMWATDQENKKLEQGPDVDTPDPADAPFWIPYPPAPVTVPVFPSVYVGMAAAFGAGILAYFVRRRLIDQK